MKNLVSYEIKDKACISIDMEHLADNLFLPCGPLNQKSIGFVHTPFDSFIEHLPDAQVLTVRKQVKTPKPTHVKSIVKDKVEEHFQQYGVRPNKKAIEDIKYEAFMSLLPHTFPDEPVDTQIIISNDGHIYLDTTYSKAEEVISLLREVVGSLPLELINTNGVINFFNEYVLNKLPEPFTLGDKCKLCDKSGVTSAISGGSLYSSEAPYLITAGASVHELGLGYDGTIEKMVVKENLEISGIKFEKSFLSEGEGDKAGTFMMQYRELIKMFTKLKGEVVQKEEERGL